MSEKQIPPLDESQPEPELDTLRKATRTLLETARAEPVPASLRDAATVLGDALDRLRAAGKPQ